MEQLGSHWTDFCETYFSIFQQTARKIRVLLKRNENNGYVPTYIYDNILPNFSYNEKLLRQMLQRKSKHNFVFNYFFFCENRAVYEITWKNMVEPEKPKMTNNTTHKRCDLHAG